MAKQSIINVLPNCLLEITPLTCGLNLKVTFTKNTDPLLEIIGI
jgi:hypothetical protein